MAVDRSETDGKAFRKSELLRPFLGKRAHFRIGRIGLLIQMALELQQQRIHLLPEIPWRQTAPSRMPEGLVPGDTPAPRDPQRVCVPRQQCRDPVTVVHPGEGLGTQVRGMAEHLQDLRPAPLARIRAAGKPRVVLAPPVGHFVDPVRLFETRMVLPKGKHGVGILFMAGRQSQRHAGTVRKGQRRGRHIERHAGKPIQDLAADTFHRLPDAFFHGLKVIQRMLPVLAGRRITV